MLLKKPVHCYEDIYRLAKKRLPAMIFDYIDGTAGHGFGERLNHEAIKKIRLLPRILKNVEQRSLSVSLFEKEAKLPFGICPMGLCNLAWPETDIAFAKIAAKYSVPIGVSTAASTSLETMIERANGHAWFQLYHSGDMNNTNALLKRAQSAGYETLILTVDVAEVGRRPRELQHEFTMPIRLKASQLIDLAIHPSWSLATLIKGPPNLANFGGKYGEFDRHSSRAGADWLFLEKLRETWKGKLVIKGVLHEEDALKLQQAGVDAIQVSAHGGRQLDSGPPAINALGRIREAVGKSFPLFYDTGVRGGEDIVKAYAMGANFVFLGRPFSFAMAAGGQTMIEKMIEILTSEISITLALLGLNDIKDVTKEIILSS